MRDYLLGLNHYFSTVPDTLRPYRWWVLLVSTMMTLFFIAGLATRFEMDVTMDSFFDDADEVTKAMDDFRRQFGSDDGLFLVYEAKDGDIFSAQSLAAVRELTDKLDNAEDLILQDDSYQDLDHIQRVQSITNISIQLNQGDTLVSRKLVPDEIPQDRAGLEEIRALADSQRNLKLFMFSEDHRFGAINVQTDFGAIPKSESQVVSDIDLEAEALDDSVFEDDFDVAFDDFELEVDESADVKEVEFEDTESTVYMGFSAAVKSVYNQTEFTDHLKFYPVGNSAMVDLAMDTMVQAGFLMLLMIVVVIGLLWTLLHSASAVVWSILAIVISLVWVIGATLWMGFAVSQMVSLTVMLVLAVGIADCVHVLSTYLFYRREGEDHAGAMRHSYGKTGLPILLTTITTMAGMLALTSMGMPMFKQFGIMSAAAVFMAFLFTLYLLPVLMDFWHPELVGESKQQPVKSWRRWLSMPFRLLWMPFRWLGRVTGFNWLVSAIWLQPLLDRIPAFVARRPVTISALFFGLFAVFVFGAMNVRIDTNLVELYDPESEFSKTYNIVDKEMMGTGSMTIMLDMAVSEAFTDPEVLKATETLQKTIEQKYSDYIIRTNSLSDLVKETNKTMNDGTDSYYFIPDDQLSVSQLLYLFNSANPEDRRALVSDDYAKSHISINLRNAGSYEYAQFYGEMTQDIDRIFEPLKERYPDMNVTVTGTLTMMMSVMDRISTEQFKSLSLAMVIISVLMMLTLGSLQAGILGIIPNLIPAVVTFGLMGWMGVPLDTDTLMIAPVIIGIAVDDTIHFITHYRMALARTHDMQESLISAIKEVGQAVTFTTLILGCGFLMLSFSDYLGLAKMGIFGSMAVFFALLCDLLFLPALIMIFKPRFGQNEIQDNFQLEGERK